MEGNTEKIISKYYDPNYKIYDYKDNIIKTQKDINERINERIAADDALDEILHRNSDTTNFWQDTTNFWQEDWQGNWPNSTWKISEHNPGEKTKPKKDGLEAERKKFEEAMKKLEEERSKIKEAMKRLEEERSKIKEAMKKLEEERTKVRAELEKEFQEKLKKAKEALVPRRPHMEDLLV